MAVPPEKGNPMTTTRSGDDRRLARLEADAQLLAARLEVVQHLTTQAAETVADLADALIELIRANHTFAEHLGKAREEWVR